MKQRDMYDFITRCDSYQSLEPLFADYARYCDHTGSIHSSSPEFPTHGDDVDSLTSQQRVARRMDGTHIVNSAIFGKDPVSQWSLTRSETVFVGGGARSVRFHGGSQHD